MTDRIINLTRKTVLAETCRTADTMITRMRGLLGRSSFKSGEGLWIKPCNSIHMFFMAFAIDAVFIDQHNKVVGLVGNIQPWRLSPVFWKAASVIELPAGTIALSQTSLGDQIDSTR